MAQSIVLITGGSNGIGLAACAQFAQQAGVHVIMGSRSQAKGEKAAGEISKGELKGSISVVQLDVSSDESIAAAVKEVTSNHGRLDTLINNAGICPTEVSREIYRETFEVNVISPAMVTRAFAPLLQKSKDPRIIYVSSTLGSIGFRNDASEGAYHADYEVYRVSKAALNMVVACDAWTHKDHGFKTFAYCPGFVVSDLADMREQKLGMSVPGPEVTVKGLLAIHEGKQDANIGKFLHDKSVLEGAAPKPW